MVGTVALGLRDTKRHVVPIAARSAARRCPRGRRSGEAASGTIVAAKPVVHRMIATGGER
jgi:hypothetical protein